MMEPINLLNIRRGVVSLLLLSVSILLGTGICEAAIQCYDCHGTSSNSDYRPVDAAVRNYSTGGVVGNHRTHMAFPAAPAECTKCHGNSGYSASHRDNKIQLSANLNTSPAPGGGQYRVAGSPVTFKNHTSVPLLGSCSNVNCHFEKATPVWGSATFTYASSTVNDCDQCHGAPPSGGVTGAAGSHAKHDTYYSGAGNCAKCHTDHVAESGKFSHATSAGRNLNISFAAAPNNGGGAYSGALNDYLPSQNPTGTAGFGDCTATYCHSTGTKNAAPYSTALQTATWGATLRTDCTACHKGDKTAFKTMSSSSHFKHVGIYNYGCVKCHAGTVSANRTIKSGAIDNHVNKLVNIAFNNSTTAVIGSARYNGTIAPMTKAPGSALGQCTNVYCHSTVQGNSGVGAPTAYGTPTWGGTTLCSGCHRSIGHAGIAAGDGSSITIDSGSHTKHLAYNYGLTGSSIKCVICHKWNPAKTMANDCNNCHGETSKHANGLIDVAFDSTFGSGPYNGTGKPGDGYNSCSNVSCHFNTTTPAWGTSTPIGCVGCHSLAALLASGSHGKHISATAVPTMYNYTANRSTAAEYNFGCSNCHPLASANHWNNRIDVTLKKDEAGRGSLRGKNSATGFGIGAINSGITGTTKTNVVCTASYCHSNGDANPATRIYAVTPNWYGTGFPAGTDRCANCHGNAPNSTIAGSKAHYNNRFLGYTSNAGGHQIGIHAMKIYSSPAGLAHAGTATSSSHGNSGTSTTISCNICHYDTITSARNDNNGVCKACHVSGNSVGALFGNPAAIANKAKHVNGTADVAFQSIAVRSKAQMRPIYFAIGAYSSAWKRTGGYKSNGGHDLAKAALNTGTMWNSIDKTCSNVACHNGQSVKWSDTNGVTDCVSCHTAM